MSIRVAVESTEHYSTVYLGESTYLYWREDLEALAEALSVWREEQQ